MKFIYALIVLVALQGPAMAFNPIKSVITLPFKVVKLAAKVATAPVKLAYNTGKGAVKTTAADKVAVFMIKNAPYKDLAFMAL